MAVCSEIGQGSTFTFTFALENNNLNSEAQVQRYLNPNKNKFIKKLIISKLSSEESEKAENEEQTPRAEDEDLSIDSGFVRSRTYIN